MKGYKNKNDRITELRPGASPKKPEDAKAELALLRGKISILVGKDPSKAATILTEWLNSSHSNKQASARKKAG